MSITWVWVGLISLFAVGCPESTRSMNGGETIEIEQEEPEEADDELEPIDVDEDSDPAVDEAEPTDEVIVAQPSATVPAALVGTWLVSRGGVSAPFDPNTGTFGSS